MMKPVWYGGLIFVLILFSATFVFAALPPEQNIKNASQPDTLEKVLSRGTLIVAIDPSSGSYSEIISGTERDPNSNCSEIQYTENQVTGFDVEVASAIARELGVDSCYVTPEYSEIDQGDWEDKWDVYPSFFVTYERLDKYYFTQPIVSESSVFFIRTNDTSIASVADLSGKKIGTYPNSAQSRYLDNTLELPGLVNKNPIQNATVIGYDTESLAYGDLLSGNLDAVLFAETTRDMYLDNITLVKALQPKAFTGFSGLTLVRGTGSESQSFAMKLSEIIQKLHEEGELTNISRKYFDQDITADAKSFNMSFLNKSEFNQISQ